MTRAAVGLRGWTLIAGLCAGLTAWAMQPSPARDADVYQETLYVFGTLVEIVIHDQDPDRAAMASARVGALLQDLHRNWHAWRPGALTRLNTAIAAERGADVPRRLADVLAQGQTLACLSGGLFEPAIGRTIALWGFHQDTPPTGAPPDAALIDRLHRANPRMRDLRITGRGVTSDNPAVQLDLGGFAKGAALDLAADVLREAGISHAVLNAGGDVVVLGHHGGDGRTQSPARAWRVAIRDPFDWGVIAALDLAPGEGLYTSGNYERFFDHAGTRFAHIIDPRTGWPVQEIVSATVLHREGARADAAATALSVAGSDNWAQTAADMGIADALVVSADGRLLATPSMASRLTALSDDVTVMPLPETTARACIQPHTLSALRQ